MRYNKIIIVGESNVCRSFMAEAILKKILEDKASGQFEVASRGIVVLFSEPVSPFAATILVKHDYPISKVRSEQFGEEDLNADLILTLTESIAARLRETYNPQTTCMSLAAFTDMEELGAKAAESEEGYEEMFGTLEPLMEEVAWRLVREFDA